MARVKSTKLRQARRNPPQPSRVQWVPAETDQQTNHDGNMSDKRPATDSDIDVSKSKSARTSPPSNAIPGPSSSAAGGAAGGSAALAKKVPLSHSCFMQIYMQEGPWDPNGEKEAWMKMDTDSCNVKFDMESGINFIFHDDHYKIIPYGPVQPTIGNREMCAYDVPPGCSMRWMYDHIFHYHHKNIRRAFMVVRLPTEQIPTGFPMFNGIETVMRDRFKIARSSDLTTPCWFPSSQVERERDHFKALFETQRRQYVQTIRDYNELDERTTLLEENLDKCEAKISLQTATLQTIDEALQCAICLERFSSTNLSMMASCGHVIHTACQEQQKAKGELKCVTCRAPVRYWQDFRGFTAISEAITKLNAALDSAK